MATEPNAALIKALNAHAKALDNNTKALVESIKIQKRIEQRLSPTRTRILSGQNPYVEANDAATLDREPDFGPRKDRTDAESGPYG